MFRRKLPYVALGAIGIVIALAAYVLWPASGEAQEISIDVPSSVTFGAAPVPVLAEASSGLPTELTVAAGPCLLKDGALIAEGAGRCTLRATQAGDNQYHKTDKTHHIEVAKAPQTISFDVLPPRAYGEAAFRVEAVSNSGLPVAYTASGACTVREAEVTLTSPGSCTLSAAQSGNTNFLAAGSISQKFRIYDIKMNVSTKTEYYMVSGTTSEAIFASMELNGPRLRGTPVLGLISAQPHLNDQKLTPAVGQCEIESMTMSFTLTITLPQHPQAASLNSALRAKWAAFAAAVEEHEKHHAAIYTEGASQIRSAMVAIPALQSCAALQVEINRVWAEQSRLLEENQDEFHVEDDARIERLRAPIKAKLDALDASIASLDAQIRGLEAQTARIEAEMASIEGRLPGIEAQIRNLERAYPNGAPSNVLAQYDSLISQYNSLVARANQLQQDGNALVGQRNALASQYNSALASRGGLVDEYNWLY